MRLSIRSDVSVNEWRGKDFETFFTTYGKSGEDLPIT